MRRITILTVATLLSSLGAADAAAQWNVARFATERNRVYTTFGLDPAIVTSVGVAHVESLLDRDVQVSAEAGVVAARFDTRDFRTRLGVRSSLVSWRSLQLTGSATAIARGTSNSVYRGINFGADLTAAAGVYRPRWFAAVEGGKDKAIITHVRHTDWYREYFYADAKDGWYLDAGGTMHYGVAAGFTLSRAELVTRLGVLRTEDGNSLMPPMYLSVGLGLGF